MLTRRQFLQMGGGLIALGATGTAYGTLMEPGFRLVTTQWRVAHPHWPPAAAPLRITVLTDLHAMDPYMPVRRIEKIVDAANALQSDLVVLLGDFVAGGSATSRRARRADRRLGCRAWPAPRAARRLRDLRQSRLVERCLGVRDGLHKCRHPHIGERAFHWARASSASGWPGLATSSLIM